MYTLQYNHGTIDVDAINAQFVKQEVPWTATIGEPETLEGDKPFSFAVVDDSAQTVFFNLPDARQYAGRAGSLYTQPMLLALLIEHENEVKDSASGDALLSAIRVENDGRRAVITVDTSRLQDAVYHMGDIVVNGHNLYVTRLSKSGANVQDKYEDKLAEAQRTSPTA